MRNKVFVSKELSVPKLFAAGTDPDARKFMMEGYERAGSPRSTKEVMKISDKAFEKAKGATILKTRIPNAYWKHMKADPYMPGDYYGKDRSAYLSRKLPAKYIGSKSILPHLDPRSIAKHISKEPGTFKSGLKDMISGLGTVAKLGIKKRL